MTAEEKRITELLKTMKALIEKTYETYQKLQDVHRSYTGKEHVWLK